MFKLLNNAQRKYIEANVQGQVQVHKFMYATGGKQGLREDGQGGEGEGKACGLERKGEGVSGEVGGAAWAGGTPSSRSTPPA
jgi:hypothetical protein